MITFGCNTRLFKIDHYWRYSNVGLLLVLLRERLLPSFSGKVERLLALWFPSFAPGLPCLEITKGTGPA